jgi:hypothetical protein
VLVGLEISDGAVPVAGGPDGEVERGLRPGLTEDGGAVDGVEGHAQLLGHLAAEGGSGGLTWFDVTAGEVPDSRVPAAGRGAVAEQELVVAAQDHRDDVVGFHGWWCTRPARSPTIRR